MFSRVGDAKNFFEEMMENFWSQMENKLAGYR